MARTKTTETSSITAAQLADGDLIPVIDVSDTTMSSTGTNKKLAKSQLAEAAGVTAHLADTNDAHDASAISFSATGNIVATDVQAAIAELDSEKATVTEPIAATHIALGTDAHDASAISYNGSSNLAADDVEEALDELDAEKIAAATLTVDGDILTRASGVPAPITRANLAADSAFTSQYAKPIKGKTGDYWSSGNIAATANVALSVGLIHYIPIYVPGPADRIVCNVGVAGGAGTKIRMGLYSRSATTGEPETKLTEAATDAAADATGVAEVTIAYTGGAAWLYVALVTDAASIQLKQTYGLVLGLPGGATAADATNDPVGEYIGTKSGLTLPTTAAVMGLGKYATRVAVRLA